MTLTISQLFSHRKIWVLFLLGFGSGLPFIILLSTLSAWFTQMELSLSTIGLLTLLRQPYAYKFLWAPLIDRYKLPWGGRRHGWLILTQLLCAACMIMMGFLNPQTSTHALFVIAALLALVSATQDIVSSAYLTDTCNEDPNIRGLGAVSYTTGYRVAMIIGGAVALVTAQKIGWPMTMALMGTLMSIGIIGTLFAPTTALEEVDISETSPLIQQLRDALGTPLKRFGWIGFVVVLITIILYKAGDALALSLSTPFLYKAMGFTMEEIGYASKTIGMLATILGGVLGGYLMTRMSLFQSLFYFGWSQSISTLGFAYLSWVGHDYTVMIIAVWAENFCSGLGTCAFLAFLMSLCCEKHSATQYAIFSGVAALPSIFSGPISSALVTEYGWLWFYLFCSALSLPGIAMVWLLRRKGWLD